MGIGMIFLNEVEKWVEKLVMVSRKNEEVIMVSIGREEVVMVSIGIGLNIRIGLLLIVIIC